jgi:hypothetical protein
MIIIIVVVVVVVAVIAESISTYPSVTSNLSGSIKFSNLS